MSDYYVYAYIDPRNLEEFYYGKGKGKRKEAHLRDSSDSAKAKRISDIHREGLAPIIRVLARNLTEREALLVEKTLIWKLGRYTTNLATGAFAANFRPHNTLHKELSGFDFRNGLYYYNVGDGPHRKWEDYVRYGFISAGQDKRFRDAMLGFHPGDILLAYLKRKGFVGVARIQKTATMVRNVRINGKPLLSLALTSTGMDQNSDDELRSEYVCEVKWLKHVSRDEAIKSNEVKLFTTTHIRATLDGQPETIDYLERAFELKIRDAAA